MAGTAKPSRDDELRALRGTLSGEQLQAVHDYWLEQGIDPDLESHSGDSLMSVLREAEGASPSWGAWMPRSRGWLTRWRSARG